MSSLDTISQFIFVLIFYWVASRAYRIETVTVPTYYSTYQDIKTQRAVVIRTGMIRITHILSTVNAAIHKTYNLPPLNSIQYLLRCYVPIQITKKVLRFSIKLKFINVLTKPHFESQS